MEFLIEEQESRVYMQMRRFNKIEDLRTNNILSSDLLIIVQHILWYGILITKLQNKRETSWTSARLDNYIWIETKMLITQAF